MRTALDEKFAGYVLAFQPQMRVDSSGSQICGAEALLRAPKRMPALEAILKAEEAGEMAELGEWILYKACQKAVFWGEGGKKFRVSVNVSPAQISDPQFPALVERVLKETNLQPDFLTLELSERSFMSNDPQAMSLCRAMRELGVEMILDNFGTRYSWVGYLHSLPLSGLKLAPSFVANLPSNSSNGNVVGGIINLCHDKGLKMIATGVETVEQRDALLQYGCEIQQGFLFAEPWIIDLRA